MDLPGVVFLEWSYQMWCFWRGVPGMEFPGMALPAMAPLARCSQLARVLQDPGCTQARGPALPRCPSDAPYLPCPGDVASHRPPFPLMFTRQCRFGFPAVCSLVGVASFVSRCGAAQNVQTIQKFQKASALHVLFSPGK